MLALPPAPPPAQRRQLFVGTSLAAAAGAMLIGGMLAMWLRFRQAAISGPAGRWLPEKVTVPEVPANIMLLSFIGICVFAQWAVYAAHRNDKQSVAIALSLTALLGLAVVNAQATVYVQMGIPIVDDSGSAYGVMFYAITGTMLALIIVGMAFSLVTAFRYLGGRTNDREIITAHAIYWYFIAAAFSMLWFVVYVTK